MAVTAGQLKNSRVETSAFGAQPLPEFVEAQQISDWVDANNAPETADNSGSTVTAPLALTRSDLIRLESAGRGRTLQLCLQYDAGVSVPTSPVIQVFGFDRGNKPMRLIDSNGDHELTVTVDTTSDVSDGTYKYTKPVEVDMAGCVTFLATVKTAFAATGTVNTSKILARSVSRPVAPPIEASIPGSVSLAAGTNAIGKLAANSGVDIGDVGTYTKSVRVAPAVTAGTYGAGKCVGGVQSLDLCRAAGAGFTVNSIVLQDVGGAAKPTGNILVFSASPADSTTADAGDLSLHANDEAKLIGCITVATADWKTPKTKSIAEIAVNRVYTPASGTTLYFLFVADATFGSAFAATTSFAMRVKGY